MALEKAQTMDWSALLTLLESYNTFVLHLVRNIDPGCLGNVWIVDGQEMSLQFLVRDYYRHLDWHVDHLEKRVAEVTR